MKQFQLLTCNKALVGRRVCLSRLQPVHADVLLHSFSNDRFWLAYRANQNRSIARETLIQQLEYQYVQLPQQSGQIEWLIHELHLSDTDEKIEYSFDSESVPLGLASLSSFNAEQMNAEFMIGFFQQSDIKPGLGLEASLLVLDYAFNHEKLNKLYSVVYADNPRAQRSTLALGFEQEGFLQEHLKIGDNSEFCSVYLNGLLAKKFRTNCRLSRLSNRVLGHDVTLKGPVIDSKLDSSNLRAHFVIR